MSTNPLEFTNVPAYGSSVDLTGRLLLGEHHDWGARRTGERDRSLRHTCRILPARRPRRGRTARRADPKVFGPCPRHSLSDSHVGPARMLKSFVVVIPSFNNAPWCRQNLESVLNQEYLRFRVVYVDDASTDDTPRLVAEYLAESAQA